MDVDNRSRGRERTNDRSERRSEVSRDRSPIKGENAQGYRVHVVNIPYEFRWQELKDLFREKVGSVAFVELFVDENDKPKGCGVVEFTEPDCVQKAIETLNRYEIRGRKIIVKEDRGGREKPRSSAVNRSNDFNRDRSNDFNRDRSNDFSRDRSNEFSRDRSNDFSRDNSWNRGHDDRQIVSSSVNTGADKWGGKTYGLSPSFLESLGIKVPICTRIFVANLDYKVDKKKLKEIFNLAGKVVDIDMYLDKDGNSRGNAVVEFSHPVESVQAISMFHNQELYDRKMRIYMDRFNDPHRLPEGLKSLGPGLGDAGAPLRDIAFNLPNQNSAGNVSLGISNPLNSLNASVLLQAANLGNVGNLQTNVLGKTLGGTGDIPSLVSYPIIQNQSTSNFGLSKFGSSQNFGSNVSATRGQGFESRFPSQSGSAFPRKSMIGKSNKVLLSNLPASITYKALNEKCAQIGKILRFEDKGNGSIVLSFNNEWEAERALNHLNRSHIDGCVVDAQFFQ